MKRKILSIVLLGIMVLGVSGTANAKSKKKYLKTNVSAQLHRGKQGNSNSIEKGSRSKPVSCV